MEANPYRIAVKPITVAPKTPLEPQGRDTFETPFYAVDLLIPYIPKSVKTIWECACGNGKIITRLEQNGYAVFGTDIRNNPDFVDEVSNFITEEPPEGINPKNFGKDSIAIITNPPFSVKEMFIDRAFEYGVPFAFLINSDYSGWSINLVKMGCEKIIPNRRIDFITPTGRQGVTSSSQFHSMWLTYGFGLGRTETFVELSLQAKKENI